MSRNVAIGGVGGSFGRGIGERTWNGWASIVKAQLEVWAYFLMTNHVHLLVLPRREESLAKGIGLAHRRFAVFHNKRKWDIGDRIL